MVTCRIQIQKVQDMVTDRVQIRLVANKGRALVKSGHTASLADRLKHIIC